MKNSRSIGIGTALGIVFGAALGAAAPRLREQMGTD
jgi:hypothetical protein